MELHTMGVHGGYTQDDVREAARCLSGWTFDPKRFFALNQSEAFFKPDWHDDGSKQLLGQTIPAGGGRGDLDRLVDMVCSHASTAHFLALKLCRRFVSTTPPDSLVKRVAAEFTRTRGDIKCVLRLLLNSAEFMASRGQLLKRPFRYMVSAMRALAADTQAEKPVLEPLQRMGHGLFQYPTPDGYTDDELPWMGTLMWRWNFGLAIAAGKQPGVRFDLHELGKALRDGAEQTSPSRWFAHLVGRAPKPEELTNLGAGDERQTLGLILAGPAFQRC
jgi:uncharacterized protein (DUF1800 family)